MNSSKHFEYKSMGSSKSKPKPQFNDLYPNDIISLILLHVPPLTIVKCHRVCRQFYTILQKNHFWKDKLHHDFSHSHSYQNFKSAYYTLLRHLLSNDIGRLALGLPLKYHRLCKNKTTLFLHSSFLTPEELDLARILSLTVTPIFTFRNFYFCRQCHSLDISVFPNDPESEILIKCNSCGYKPFNFELHEIIVERLDFDHYRVSRPKKSYTIKYKSRLQNLP